MEKKMGLLSIYTGVIVLAAAVIAMVAGVVAWFMLGLIPILWMAWGAIVGDPAPVDWGYKLVMNLIIMFIAVPLWNYVWLFVAMGGAALSDIT
jgi:hypothetical protein